MPRLRRSDNVGDFVQPCRAGLTFGGRPLRQAQGRLYGLQKPQSPSGKHPDGPVNCRSLGYARDDKGEGFGGASISWRCFHRLLMLN